MELMELPLGSMFTHSTMLAKVSSEYDAKRQVIECTVIGNVDADGNVSIISNPYVLSFKYDCDVQPCILQAVTIFETTPVETSQQVR